MCSSAISKKSLNCPDGTNTARIVSLFHPSQTTFRAKSELIGRAVDSPTTAVQNVGVNHGRTDILVPEQLLDRPNIIAVLKQVRGNAFKPFDSFEPFESLERLSGPFKLLAFHRAALQISDEVTNHD